METRRVLLIAALMFVGLMLWNAWQAEHAPPPVVQSQNAPTAMATTSTATDTVAQTINTINPANRYVHVKTDVLDATIDKVGGELVGVKLLKYPTTQETPSDPYVLLNQNPNTFYIAKSGLSATPEVFQSTQSKDGLTITLTRKDAEGAVITKTYQFAAGQYLVQMNYQVDNKSSKPWQGQFFAELQRKQVAAKSGGPFHFNTYLGAVFSTPDKRYQKLSFENMAESNLDTSTQNGWVAMVEHYFLSAWVPNPTENYHYYTRELSNNIYGIGFNSSPLTVAPGATMTTGAKLYVGPEIASNLKEVAPGLDLTIDYGVLWFIAVILFGAMQKIHSVVGNWGWSIVLVTALIKLVFYKLNSISFQSMANMRELQPKLQQLRERFGDDKQKMSQATMELYRKEKINPLSGCLPMIVQIPVFLSLYWVLIESVQLRQAPFILWIHDLSAKDPYYVLPLLMGLTIFIQQLLSPKAPDPMQQKIMMMLPIVFTVLFLSFPSGLVLYWVVNNTLSIMQQYYITRHVVPKAAAKRAVKNAKKR